MGDKSQLPSRLTRLSPAQYAQRKPVPRQTEMGRRRRPIAMFALALGGFGIGTTSASVRLKRDTSSPPMPSAWWSVRR